MRKPHSSLYGLSIKDIARICRVSEKTASRWKSGQIVPPFSAVALLTADLGTFDPAWEGWRLWRGKLITPENIEETPGSVRAIPFMQAQISTYQSENRYLKRALSDMEFQDQPLPGDWEIEIATG